MSAYFVGVDVGSASVRAGLFDRNGCLLKTCSQAIKIFEPEQNHYEQSSDDIWHAVCNVVGNVTDGIEKNNVKSIGFDATCSLVVLDGNGAPVSVSSSGCPEWNIIMWMDHRAQRQALRVDAVRSDALKYVGGHMSLEMQVPKLMWLKQNLHEQCWSKAKYFMDLCDFLTWKCTTSLSRSLCSLVCKWCYRASKNTLDNGFYDDLYIDVGLSDLVEEKFARVGQKTQSPGTACRTGLSVTSASELGLSVGTVVSMGMVDAHAGGVGCLSCISAPQQTELASQTPLSEKLVLVCGTSTCLLMALDGPVFVPGVWGPYYSSMIPDLWTLEGGQSATGKLLDHVLETHPARARLRGEAERRRLHECEVLMEVLQGLSKQRGGATVSTLTRDLHVYPDYHGNRSPLADAGMKGMVSGLTLEKGMEDLALIYLATIQALAYGTKQIVDSFRAKGQTISEITVSGGLAKNMLNVQTIADVTGCPVVIPRTAESVLLGSAILAAAAAAEYSSVQAAMTAMGGSGTTLLPDVTTRSFHERKYAVFLKMQEDQRQYKTLMSEQTS